MSVTNQKPSNFVMPRDVFKVSNSQVGTGELVTLTSVETNHLRRNAQLVSTPVIVPAWKVMDLCYIGIMYRYSSYVRPLRVEMKASNGH